MRANWKQWFALAGVDILRSSRGPAYGHGSMAVEAAIRGEGVALGYDLVYRAGNERHPKVCVLREWLADEIRMLFAGNQ
ncbi:hypothetical protein [Paraburkholderia sp. BL10I2N1]|uniref:hypothetical protein n=1 Tax=Paraburkholderia sp. BL10I2N1 TaxID=1938796 RepID=UPI001FB7D76A|nr:hypothetical protein [Paraburkholderia sp. BL10I2N1]